VSEVRLAASGSIPAIDTMWQSATTSQNFAQSRRIGGMAEGASAE